MSSKLAVSAKFKAAVVLACGGLAAFAVPGSGAQAATYPAGLNPHPGLKDPNAEPSSAASTTGQKVATPDAVCGGNTITWQDEYDGRYLEVADSKTTTGAWVDAYNGNGTCTQQWFAVSSGSWPGHSLYGGGPSPMYAMVNTNSDMCLAAATVSVGNRHVVQESCGYSKYQYRWAEIELGSGYYGLAEAYIDGRSLPVFSKNEKGIIACEDTANYWVYTSYVERNGVDNLALKNCRWH